MSNYDDLRNQEVKLNIEQYPTGLTREQILELAKKNSIKLELCTEDGRTVDLIHDNYVEASDSEILQRAVTIL